MSYATTLRGMTPAQAAQSVMPQSAISSTAGFTQAVYNDIVAAATAGNFSAFNPSGCSGISPTGARIVNTASGLALSGLSVGLALGTTLTAVATAGITAGASILVGLFVSIYAAHAAKVKAEQQVVCASVPAAADSLTAIEQAVTAGTITPAQGITALQSLEQAFSQNVASIIKNDASHCNAACVWVKELEAIVLYKSSQYQDMETAAAAKSLGTTAPASGVTSSTPGATATTIASTPAAAAAGFAMPTWGWLAVAAGLIFLVAD
jgi:hypothetical protein